jgi:signal transduction histidine kinase
MGNVAHDLKTPLHSIAADIEALSMLLSKIPAHYIRIAESKINCHSNCKIDSKSIFESLNASSQFMAMAINRSQDFMKARYICIYMGVYVYMYIYVDVCVCVYI